MTVNDPVSSSPRLRHGCHLFPIPGGWALYGPGDDFLRVQAESGLVARVAAALAGEAPAHDPEELALLDRLRELGLLVAGESGPDGDLPGRRVEVRGEGPVAGEVAARLAREGVGEVACLPLDAPVTGADLVVACAGWLPDARFRALDAECSARRIPWHGCHAEGDRFYLGPIALPGETATYADTRARRLSASSRPAELEAYWRWLDEGRGIPDVIWPDAGCVAALAGALVSDSLAVLRGRVPASAGYQLAFEPATFEWRRHPVLPVPRTLAAAS